MNRYFYVIKYIRIKKELKIILFKFYLRQIALFLFNEKRKKITFEFIYKNWSMNISLIQWVWRDISFHAVVLIYFGI